MFRSLRMSFSAISLLAGLLLAACNANPISPTPTGPALESTNTPGGTPTVQPSPTPTPNTSITLTLWAPPAFSPGPDTSVQRLLDQQLQTFAISGEGFPVQVLTKKANGGGGLLDLLRSASPVAPGILPDVIALDTTDLETAARAGLIQPIDDLISPELLNDLAPAARGLGTINGGLYGVVYSLDLGHLAYITRSIETVPLTWNEVLTSTQRYIFALHAPNNSVSDSVLAQYLAFGGTLLDSDRHPTLDADALTGLLDLYVQAQKEGVLPANVLDLNGPDDVWNSFVANKAALVNVSASRYLTAEQTLPDLSYAALPAIKQPTPPLARGWALAIVTADPDRQLKAMRLIDWLLSADRNGAWSQAAHILPGRLSSLDTWNQSDPYTTFIRLQLQAALPAPSASTLNTLGPILRKAIDDVLSGRAAPADAAQAALAAVNGGSK
jgi:ABC-type glycerol-3-phosphate transport system substrate-binding protein